MPQDKKTLTPIQTLIELWKNQITEIPPNIADRERLEHIYNLFIKDAEALLPAERQGLIDGYNQGYRDGEHDASNRVENEKDISEYEDGEQWFLNKYENKGQSLLDGLMDADLGRE